MTPDQEVLALLNQVRPEIGQTLVAFRDRPLRDYARALYAQTARPLTPIQSEARMVLARALVTNTSNMAEGGEEEIVRALQRCTAIQTGPHCTLLLEPRTYRAYALSWLGANATEQPMLLAYQCTTTTLETSTRRGSGWLTTASGPVNLFGLSRGQLSKHSVCAALPNLAIRCDEADKKLAAELRNLTTGIEAQRPADMIQAINRRLWAQWTGSPQSSLLIMDDRIIAKALADHLRTRSPLFRLLFDAKVRATAMAAITEFATAYPDGRFLRWGTDFFWIFRDGRIRAARLHNNQLVEVGGGTVLAFEPATIIDALEREQILPNLLLVFLIVAIAPSIRPLGGPNQIGYLPAFVEIWRRCLDAMDLPDEAAAVTLDHGLGMSVIEHGLRREFPTIDRDMRAFCHRVGAMPLVEAADFFSAIRENYYWRSLDRPSGKFFRWGRRALRWFARWFRAKIAV